MTQEEMKGIMVPFIPDPVKQEAETNQNMRGYIGWLKPIEDEVVVRIFAFRKRKNKPTDIREVIRLCPSIEGLYQRDMYLTAMSGWQVNYKPQKRSSSSWYGYKYYDIDESDFGKWEWSDRCGIIYKGINLEALNGTKYEHCGYNTDLHIDLVEYLRLYLQDPAVEFFGKAGITPSKTLIKKAKKDRDFITWMRRFDEIRDYGPQVIIYAYDHKKSLKQAAEELQERNEAIAWCKGYFRASDYGFSLNELKKIFRYAKKNFIGAGSYRDYLDALRGLNLDLADTKNLYPKDFQRMHDLRTNQWSSKVQKVKNKEFQEVCKKYIKYEAQGKGFVIKTPEKIDDLKREGKILEHCVGCMGYDKKMLNGVSFIAFLRRAEDPGKPYVTIEYGIEPQKVLQVYGKNDSKPEPDVLEFVKGWEKQCRKIQKEELKSQKK